jgi:hypothetical protein
LECPSESLAFYYSPIISVSFFSYHRLKFSELQISGAITNWVAMF